MSAVVRRGLGILALLGVGLLWACEPTVDPPGIPVDSGADMARDGAAPDRGLTDLGVRPDEGLATPDRGVDPDDGLPADQGLDPDDGLPADQGLDPDGGVLPDMAPPVEPEPPAQLITDDEPLEAADFRGGTAAGDYGVLALGVEGVGLADAHEPDGLLTFGPFGTSAPTEDVAAHDGAHIAYAAVGEAGVDVLDYSDPANTRVITTLPTEAAAHAVALDAVAARLYVGLAGGVVVVFDLADARAPTLLEIRIVLQVQARHLRLVVRDGVLIGSLADGTVYRWADGALGWSMDSGCDEGLLGLGWAGGGVFGACDNALLGFDVATGAVIQGMPAGVAGARWVSGWRDTLSVGGATGVITLRIIGVTVTVVAVPPAQGAAPLGVVGLAGGVLAVFPERVAYVNTPPFVVAVEPADGAQDVARNVTARVRFSELVEPASLAAGGFIFPVGGFAPAPGDTSALNAWEMAIDPTDPLAANAEHSVSVLADVTDLQGASLSPLNGFSSRFTTGERLDDDPELDPGAEGDLSDIPAGAVAVGDVSWFCLEDGRLEGADASGGDENVLRFSPLELPGPCQAIDADEGRGLLTIAAGAAGLVVVDVSVPANARVIATFDVGGVASAVAWAAAEGWVYVGVGGDVVAVDLYDPANPRVVVRGGYDFAGPLRLAVGAPDVLLIVDARGVLHAVGRRLGAVLHFWTGPGPVVGVIGFEDGVFHVAVRGHGVIVVRWDAAAGRLVFVRRVVDAGVDVVAVWRRGATVVVALATGELRVFARVWRRVDGVRVQVLVRVAVRAGLRGVRVVVIVRYGAVVVGFQAGGWQVFDLPPFLVGTEPADGAEGADPQAGFVAVFSEPVRVAGDNALGVTHGGASVGGAVAGDGTWRLSVPGPLAANAAHVATVGPDITDLGGNRLVPAEPTAVEFMTVEDAGDPGDLADQPGDGLADPEGVLALGAFGDHGYACGADGQLEVMDLSDPENPQVISRQALPARCVDVSVDEDAGRLYLAVGVGGVLIYDLADPANPLRLGRWLPEGGVVGAVTVADGGRIYVAVGGDLFLLDVSVVANIRVVVRAPAAAGGVIVRVRVSAGVVVAVLADGTLVRYAGDTLVVVARVHLGDDPVGLVIIGDVVHVAYRGGVVITVRLTVVGFGEATPLEGGVGGVIGIYRRGDVFVTVHAGGVVRVHAIVRVDGRVVVRFVAERRGYLHIRVAVVVRGGRIIVVHARGFSVLDTPPFVVATDPWDGQADVAVGVRPQVWFSEPVALNDAVTLRDADGNGVAADVALDASGMVATLAPAEPLAGEARYTLVVGDAVADGAGQTLRPEGGVTADFTTGAAGGPGAADNLGEFEGVPDAEDMVIVGNYGYVAAGASGVVVYDLSDPDNPRIVARVAIAAGPAWRIVADAGRGVIYVAAGGVVVVIDIRDPLNARVVGTVDLPAGADCRVIDLHGDALYCASGGQVHVIEIGVGLRLTVVQTLDFPAAVVDVVIRDGRMHVVLVDGRVEIYDVVVSVRFPVRVGGFVVDLAGGGVIGRVTWRDGYLYVAVRGRGVVVWDVRNPGAAVRVTVIVDVVDAVRVRVVGTVLVVVGVNGTVATYDVSVAGAPRVISVNVRVGVRVVVVVRTRIVVIGAVGVVWGLPATVLGVYPANGQQDVGTATSVALVFGVPVVAPAGSLRLQTADGQAVPGQLVAVGPAVALRPAAPLAANTEYAIVWTDAITTEDGRALRRGGRSTFTTGADAGPVLQAVDAAQTWVGRTVTATGAGLDQGGFPVAVLAGALAPITARAANQVAVRVPDSAAGLTGPFAFATARGVALWPQPIAVAGAPTLADMDPSEGVGGTVVTLSGANFDPADGATRVSLGGFPAAVRSVQPDAIQFVVPAQLATGPVVVRVGGLVSNALRFNSLAPEGPDSWYQVVAGLNPSRRAAHTAVLRTATHEMIIFGGSTGNIFQPTTTTDLYAFNLDTFEWRDIADPANGPGGRTFHSAVYLPDSDEMLVVGGNGAVAGGVFSDVWRYDFNLNTWTREAEAIAGLAERQGMPLVLHPESGLVYAHGGANRQGNPLNETWTYDPATRQWQQLQTNGGPPPARGVHVSVIAGNTLYVFGGQTALQPTPQTVRGDTWALDLLTLTWRQIPGAGPSARAATAGVYDEIGHRLVIYGGTQGQQPFRDVWALDLDTETWADVTPADGLLPIRANHTAVHLGRGNLMVVYGGIVDLANPQSPQIYQDVWVGNLE